MKNTITEPEKQRRRSNNDCLNTTTGGLNDIPRN
jgi:hypothetical protein